MTNRNADVQEIARNLTEQEALALDGMVTQGPPAKTGRSLERKGLAENRKIGWVRTPLGLAVITEYWRYVDEPPHRFR